MKKILSILLCVCMLTGICGQSVSAASKVSWTGSPGVNKESAFQFEGGNGTVNSPYLIATADQLNAMRQDSAAHYKLIADIDLSDWGNWIPIGGTPAYGGHPGDSVNTAQKGSFVFTGSLDGDGHVISGMTIKIDENKPFMFAKANSRFYGLFAEANGSGASEKSGVYNLGLVDYTIDIHYGDLTGAVSNSNNFWLAPLVCWAMDFDVINCYTAGGTVNFTVDKAENLNLLTGGMIGGADDATIQHCYNTSDTKVVIDFPEDNTIVGGGLVGKITTTTIEECYNTGDMLLPDFSDITSYYDDFFEMEMPFEPWWASCYAGGIVGEVAGIIGRTNKSYITRCYNTGTMSAVNVDGLLLTTGSNLKCYMTDCYSIGKLTANAKSNLPQNMLYSVQGNAVKSNVTENGNAVSGSAWKYSSTLGRMVLSAIPEDGTASDPSNPTTPANPTNPTNIVEPFTDVKADSWFAEPVKWAVTNKITNGTSETSFSPDQTCTHAQILTFLWRAAGSPLVDVSHPFTNIKSSEYYYNAVVWAYSMGMLTKNSFDSNAYCTRADTVVYLWINAGSPSAAYSGNFSDVSADASYAQAVAWAVNAGVTTGTSATTFSPNNTCTRGQIVTFLYRALGK